MRSVQNKNTSTTAEAQEKFDLRIYDCGLTEYRKILKLQMQLQAQRYRDEIPNIVLIVEHQPVITLGARKKANKLLVPKQELKKSRIDVVEIRRGGGVTAHNPGQLVFYPILNLQQLGLGISEYIRRLEEVGKRLLNKLGVDSDTRQGYPGLWVEEKKIASIGVRVSRFVTYHGMSININNELGIFDLFIPCGIDEVKMTSVLQETRQRCSMSKVKEKLCQLLENHFSQNGLTEYENFA